MLCGTDRLPSTIWKALKSPTALKCGRSADRICPWYSRIRCPVLNPVYKVGDQVAEGLLQHNKGMKKAEAREKVLEMFRKLGIPDPEERIDCYPHQFSGGMKQRVVIAIAMICNPELIICDEPTTALDVTIQAQIMDL